MWSLAHLGTVAQAQDNYGQAAALLCDSLRLFQHLGDKGGLLAALERMAGLAAAQQQPERATRLLGAAMAFRTTNDLPLPAWDRPLYDRIRATIRAQLDEATFTTAWAEDRAMTLEQAIAYALDEREPAADDQARG